MTSCGGCGETISVGKVLTALDKKWHPECFKCGQCSDPITGGSFSISNGQPLCGKCVEKIGNDGGESGPMGKDCGKCGKPLTGTAVQGLSGGYWHPECFVCYDCGEVIDGSKGFIKDTDGNPLHGECAKNRGMGGVSEGEKCGRCSKELLGSCVTAMNKSFHKECFVCASCSGSISSGFLVVDDDAYCKPCHEKGKTGGQNSYQEESGTTVIETPAEKKGWLKEKDTGESSRIAREMNKQANKTTGYYGGDYDDTSEKPEKPKPAPTKKPQPKVSDGGPAFCGDCGTKNAGGRFCGECGFKYW